MHTRFLDSHILKHTFFNKHNFAFIHFTLAHFNAHDFTLTQFRLTDFTLTLFTLLYFWVHLSFQEQHSFLQMALRRAVGFPGSYNNLGGLELKRLSWRKAIVWIPLGRGAPGLSCFPGKLGRTPPSFEVPLEAKLCHRNEEKLPI